jgi:hypothetical protein
MSHVSLLQRVAFAYRRYRFVDPMAFDAREVTSSPAAEEPETEDDRRMESLPGGA